MSASDIELMQRIALREQAALAELYRRYANLVYSLAYRVLQSDTLAEEITQDIFMEVWKRPESWDSRRGKLSSWLLTVTRYTAIDRLRKEVRKPDLTSTPLDDQANLPDQDSQMTDSLWHDGQALRALIAQLPPEQAQVIHLAFFQGMTHSEMAEALHVPLGTIKTRVRLGLQKLRSLWEKP